MRRYTLSSAVLLAAYFLCAGSIEAQPNFTYLNSSFRSAAFLDDNTILIAGTRGVFSRSTDGGLTWKLEQSEFVSEVPCSMTFIDNERGWLVGSNSLMLSTDDGGATWRRGSVPVENLEICDIAMNSAGTGMCVGGSSILKTNNFGAEWELVATLSPTRAIQIEHLGGDGFVLCGGDSVWQTRDAGASWEQVFHDLSPEKGELEFVSMSRAGDGNIYIGTRMSEPRFILHTSDAGAQWTKVATPADANRLAVHGNKVFLVANSAEMYYSTNGGANWQESQVPHPRLSAQFENPGQGEIILRNNIALITVGRNGIARSDNAGRVVFTRSFKGGTNGAGHFESQNSGIISGAGLEGYETIDGGATWFVMSRVSLFQLRDVHDMSFVRNSGGLAVSEGGFGLWPVDEKFWRSAATTGSDEKINFQSVDRSIDGAVMAVGTIIPSTRGWGYLRNSGPQELLQGPFNIGAVESEFRPQDVVHVSGESWLAVGYTAANSEPGDESAGWARSDDFGDTWQEWAEAGLRTFNSVARLSDDEFVAVGVGGQIARSEDGGRSWNAVDSPIDPNEELDLHGVDFMDVINGIAVGDGVVLTTQDGGRSWKRLADFPGQLFNKVQLFYDGSAFVFGPSIDVLHLQTDIVSSVEEEGERSRFSSDINISIYPNPAVETAHISVTGSAAFKGTAQLAVRDIRGARVLEVSQAVGSRELVFDIPTQGLAGGYYIVDVRLGSQRASAMLAVLRP